MVENDDSVVTITGMDVDGGTVEVYYYISGFFTNIDARMRCRSFVEP